MLNEDQIGKNIKQLRLNHRLTQQDLANKAGITKSYLSKIERSTSSPPVSTLINLAKALGVKIDSFFNGQNSQDIAFIVRRDERQKIPRKDSPFGYIYEPIAHKFPGRHMEPYFVTIPPSKKFSNIFQHVGEECIIMLEGEVDFTIGQLDTTLSKGDSIYFDSSNPHAVRCKGPAAAQCVIIIYTPEQTQFFNS